MTAAPGPQQPDEVLRYCSCERDWPETARNMGLPESEVHSVGCPVRPAAPSAQPDMRCAYQRAGWDCERHGPAQPDRDTEDVCMCLTFAERDALWCRRPGPHHARHCPMHRDTEEGRR